jgi:DNA repair exonuclease SbcCD ATPase subunit
MRLIRLEVRNFAGIGSAAIEFGPGLNVLYGPNELGKSSLVDAVRAALLVQHKSNAAENWIPWNTERLPEVELVLEAQPQQIWRVQKTFGDSGGKSRLDASKDGVNYAKDCEGRAVHGKLRDLLRWGVPENARGLPESFLIHAILPPQDRVTAFLENGLGDDGDESARDWLQQVLQAVATDPLFKKVLAEATDKVDEAFTRSGKYSTKQSSPLVQIRGEVQEIEGRVGEAQKHWQETETVQNEIQQKKEKHLALEAKVQEGIRRLDLLQQGMELQGKVREARDSCRKIEDERKQLANVTELEKQAAQKAEQLTVDREAAVAALTLAESEYSTAREDAARLASDGAEAARQIQQKTLENERLELQGQKQSIAARAERFQRAASIAAKAEQAAKELARSNEEHTTLSGDLAKEMSVAERLRGVAAWLAWSEANDAVARFARRKAEVEGWSREANLTKEQIAAIQTKLAERNLPTADQFEALRRLAGDLDVAQRTLDVGLMVEINPLASFELKVSRDGATPIVAKRAKKGSTFEAQRELQVTLEGLAELTMRGGKADARAKVEELEARWRREAQPVLEAARAKDLVEIGSISAEHTQHREQLRTFQQELKGFQTQMEQAGDVAEELAEANRQQREREQALVGLDRDALEQQAKAYAPLAPAKRAARVQTELDQYEKKVNDTRTKLAGAEARRNEQKSAVESRQSELAQLEKELPADWRKLAEALPTELVETQKKLDDVEKKVESLGEEASQALSTAQQTVALAEAQVAARKKECDDLEESCRNASNELSKRQAERTLRAEGVHKLDLPAAKTRLAGLEVELKKLTSVPPEVTTEQIADQARLVDGIRHELDQLRSIIDRQQGALSQVGGEAARERLDSLTEALNRKRDEQDDRTREYDAWKLLKETLEQAEKSQSTHLGQALMPPLSERLAVLSQGKHQGLVLGPTLDLDKVRTGGGLQDWRRLSVGTRDQVATLFRFALAEHLRSFLILDDQLAQSDEGRLQWFRQLLRDGACQKNLQVIILTCRPRDYLLDDELPADGTPYGTSLSARAVALTQLMKGVEG